jgi:predicted enzyme related to lactoylglutathione lyase
MQPALTALTIYTKQMEAMATFYCKHFGFVASQDMGDRLVVLKSPRHGMAIQLHPTAKSQKEGQVLVKLVFAVEDVRAFCETSRENGLAFGAIHKADGYEFANAKDPAKNSVCVSSRAYRGW